MARLGQAPRRMQPALAEAPSSLGAPGQRFHNVKPVGAALGDAEDVGATSFLAQEGDGKGTLLLGDVGAMMAGLGTASATQVSLGAEAVTVIKVTKGTAETGTYRDYTTSDGYVLRRYANDDGEIYIVKSPISSKTTMLSQGDKKTGKAWASLDALIQSADKGQKPPPVNSKVLVAAIQGGSAVSVALLEAAGGKHKKRKKHGKKEEEQAPPEEDTPPSGIPWVPIAVVSAGALLLFMLSRKSSAA
jgi:hypothetical protein